MTKKHLIGMNLSLTVSEPEEFYFENGEGPFNGTIISEQEELLAIRLDKSLTYGKTTFIFIVASVRHENSSKEELLNKGRMFVNLVPVFGEQQEGDKSSLWIFEAVKHWRGGHLIGDLYKR